jgi:hypothetical protein
MPPSPRPPLSVRFCGWMVELASLFVPSAHRSEWKREWHAELWHRWQFLANLDVWNWSEAAALLRRSAGCFSDALWCFADRESVRSRVRDVVRSPWTCLASFAVALLLLASVTGGLPATRSLFEMGINAANHRLVYIWFHPISGGGDEGLPADAVAAWANRSKLVAAIAPFVVSHQSVRLADGRSAQPLLVRTVPSLFHVLSIEPALGHVPTGDAVVLSDALWRSMSQADRHIVGKKIRIGRNWYPVAAVLPRHFRFVSRQAAAYLVQPELFDAQQMVIARIKPGVPTANLDKELIRIAETACYYFFRSQLRYSFLNDAAWIPVRMFAIAAFSSALLVLLVSRASLRRIRAFFEVTDKSPALRRMGFFSAKVALASLVIFVAALEWSRSQSAILFGSRDPAAGPFLLWLYILGAMGVMFWAIADQRARCRVCLRLLCLPVRVGCPGCLLLNWSGTELLCPEGHGMMHVPDLIPSWEEGAERWIALDESWKDLFAGTK